MEKHSEKRKPRIFLKTLIVLIFLTIIVGVLYLVKNNLLIYISILYYKFNHQPASENG